MIHSLADVQTKQICDLVRIFQVFDVFERAITGKHCKNKADCLVKNSMLISDDVKAKSSFPGSIRWHGDSISGGGGAVAARNYRRSGYDCYGRSRGLLSFRTNNCDWQPGAGSRVFRGW